MAPILPERRPAPVPGMRIRLSALRAATPEAMRRGDGMNKKSARRGTEHKNRFVLRARRCRHRVDAVRLVQINTLS
ncbi:hypothetical protein [Burkholderia sp. Tr-20390]|uniref:hypothetical protein n=1 Tax=Burkholderia sp. Tr-20390 TaxID=2703904 RepID=UPI00197FB42D|nr:hypothetical protein [Burkholderia sp. Tr-20390]MBN3731120.1 hypothetical protein [Burkholderia sp. Tr-20390]